MPVIGDVPGLNLDAIVYATDFSPASENAGAYAKLLASYFSTTLVVAHAFTLSQAAMEVEVRQKQVSQQRKDLRALLDNSAASLRASSIEITTELVEGDPKIAIPALADRHASALIVLGTHGGGRIERSIIGSVAEEILRATRWPCLTVGPHTPPPAAAATPPFKRILFATDLSPAAARAAAFAVPFAESCGAAIDVLHVVPKDAVGRPGRLAELQERFYDALDAVVPRQTRERCESRTFVEVGKAHKQILDHVRERSCDLLVLGIHKATHPGLETLKSGAFQLIVDAPCPVLTVTG